MARTKTTKKIGYSYSYKRKTTRQSWSKASMNTAINAVKTKQCGYLKASLIYNVPKSTLERRAKGLNKVAKGGTKILGNNKMSLPLELEDKLAEYVLHMEECLFGLTCTDVRKMAYELAVRNNLPHAFNTDKEIAGYHWFYGFLRRHPSISLRKPENTSVHRSRSFNKTNVDQFFTLYRGLLEKFKFPPNLIYNCDEKGISTVPSAPPKILSRVGKKQVGTMASAERGTNTTVLLCGNACGDWVPPLFVFPRKKNKQELLREAPEGSIMENQLTGWMTNESFQTWLSHFIKYIGVTKERPALLILDGHTTHTKSLDSLLLAKENGLEMIVLPPHCTHRMQPLDVTCMGPLEISFSREVQLWLRNNPGQTVSINYIAGLFKPAYEKVVSSNNLVSGFEKCGLWPVKPDIFDDMFTSAHQSSAVVIEDGPSTSTDSVSQPVASVSQPVTSVSQPVASVSQPTTLDDKEPGDANTSVLTNPEDILPIPVIEYKKRKVSSKKQGKTAVVTSIPYIKELSLDEENRQLKEQLKELKKEFKALKKSSGKAAVKEPKGKTKANKVLNTAEDEGETVLRIVNKSSKTKKTVEKKKVKMKKELFADENLVTNTDPGTFILVKFSVRGTNQYYAGYIMSRSADDGEGYEVKFLRRMAVKTPSDTEIRFYYPDEDDIKTINEAQIVLTFPLPEIKKASKRQSSIISLEHSRLNDFQPIY